MRSRKNDRLSEDTCVRSGPRQIPGMYYDEPLIIEYSSEYCELDCTVLRRGYDTYRSWMLEITKLDIYYYVKIDLFVRFIAPIVIRLSFNNLILIS